MSLYWRVSKTEKPGSGKELQKKNKKKGLVNWKYKHACEPLCKEQSRIKSVSE